MKWNRFTIKTKTEAEDVIISALADVGVEGVEIQDKQPLTETDKEQMFVDIMPEGPADPGEAYGGYSPLWKALSSDCEYKGSCRIHSDCKPDIHKQIKEEIH